MHGPNRFEDYRSFVVDTAWHLLYVFTILLVVFLVGAGVQVYFWANQWLGIEANVEVSGVQSKDAMLFMVLVSEIALMAIGISYLLRPLLLRLLHYFSP